jgi:hypothetical protein
VGKTFRGGVPYSVDVRRLIETFPVVSLTEGRIVTHAQLEAVVNAKRGDQRYYGVINSWIHQMKTANGVYIIWKPSVGLEVLDPANLLEHAEVKTRQKIRQTGRAVSIYGWVDRTRLNSFGQQRFDHDKRVLGALNDAMHSAKKDLAVALGPIQSLPKPQLESGGAPPKDKKDEDNGSDRIN